MTDLGTIGRSAAAGFGLGVAWGIAARGWMRLITTEPEFSWAGTGMILAIAGLSGLALGIMYGVRRTGRSRWWRVLAVLCLLLFAGPGMIFIPAFFLGGFLYLRHAWARAIGVAGIGLSMVALWLAGEGERLNPAFYYGGFLILSLTMAAGSAELYRPRVRAVQSVDSVPSLIQ